jgi:hypothetical protein
MLTEHSQECFKCKLPDCDDTNEWCMIRRGINYGIYPKHVIKTPTIGVHAKIFRRDSYGFKEQPLFKPGEKMNAFCLAVAGYKEEGLRYSFDDFTLEDEDVE